MMAVTKQVTRIPNMTQAVTTICDLVDMMVFSVKSTPLSRVLELNHCV